MSYIEKCHVAALERLIAQLIQLDPELQHIRKMSRREQRAACKQAVKTHYEDLDWSDIKGN